jgi:hypothetical protein
VPLWQTFYTSIYLFYYNNFNDFICRLSSFLYLVLLPILQAHAIVVRLHLVIDFLLLPLLPVTGVLVLDRSRSALIFHVLLNLLELS